MGLYINEVHTTIGVQGYTNESGKMVCIESFTNRKFGYYPICDLILRMKMRNPKVRFIKIYKKTPISVPSLEWYKVNGDKMSREERNEVWGYSL